MAARYVPGPNDAGLWKLFRRLLLVGVTLLTLLIGVGVLVTSVRLSPEEKKIMAYAGEANEKHTVTSTLTLEEAESLLTELSKVHPDLAHPRNILRARNTCLNLQQGYSEEEAVSVTAKRFGNDDDRIFNNNQGAQILRVIRANGFCQEEGFVRP